MYLRGGVPVGGSWAVAAVASFRRVAFQFSPLTTPARHSWAGETPSGDGAGQPLSPTNWAVQSPHADSNRSSRACLARPDTACSRDHRRRRASARPCWGRQTEDSRNTSATNLRYTISAKLRGGGLMTTRPTIREEMSSALLPRSNTRWIAPSGTIVPDAPRRMATGPDNIACS